MNEFKECENCAGKPGSPTLCNSCYNRRKEFYSDVQPVVELSNLKLSPDKVEAFLAGYCPTCDTDMRLLVLATTHYIWNALLPMMKKSFTKEQKIAASKMINHLCYKSGVNLDR